MAVDTREYMKVKEALNHYEQKWAKYYDALNAIKAIAEKCNYVDDRDAIADILEVIESVGIE